MYDSASASDVYHFNHEYGFGVVDAGAAVALARNWSLLPPFRDDSEQSGTLNTPIPDYPASGITHSLTLDTEIDFIEFVEVEVTIDHDYWRDLQIELVSPDEIVSTLAVARSSPSTSPGTFRFGSAKHLGEDPNGQWQLRVSDQVELDSGTLESWSITVYGHGFSVNAPEFNDGASTTRSVAENTASGENVGSAVAATDADSDTLTYSLGGTDVASFLIVGASGQILTSAALNYEQKTSYSVTVSVADGEGGTDTIGVTISVTDESEPPDAPEAATSGATDSLDVSWSAPDTTGRPAISDYDVQYRKSGDTAWTDHAHTGTSTTTTIGSLDSGTTYQVQVRATNAEGTSDWSSTGTGSTGTPANNAPEFSDGASTTRSVAENTASGANVGAAVAATDDDSDTLTYSLDGTDAASFDITSTSGQILTSAALNYEQKTSYSVTVSVAEYTVRVKATNIHGDSDWSDEAGGTPSSKPPPSVTITTGADQPIDGPFAVTITFNEEVEGLACADEPPDPNEVACDIGAGYVGGALVDVVDLQEAGVNANGEHVFTARVEDILTGTLTVSVRKGKARAVDGGLPNAFGALQVEVKALDHVPQQPVTTVWQASMDVEDVGGYLGYGKAGGHSGGSLTGDTFSWSGQEYTVEALLYNQAIGEVIL